MKYDYLIVGAGLAGSVLAERIANELNKKVLLIDRRSHIGGNCFDYIDEYNIQVHKYGPHIFHTNNKKVWDYVSRFTDWHIYFHTVLAVVEGKKVPIPFNLNSIYKLFPKKYAERLEELLIERYGYGIKVPILKLLENSDGDLKFLADYIYKNIFLGYNLKQWGLKPEELDRSVSGRVPVFVSQDDRYFQDTYQGIPVKGYTSLIGKMLSNPNIELRLNTDFKSIAAENISEKTIFTGMLDEYFNYEFGELPYRSLDFEMKTFDYPQFQKVAQVNYPNNYDFTRITEFKHFSDAKNSYSTIAIEYPTEYKNGVNEPYYPIPNPENGLLFDKYKKEAENLKGKVYFLGRLAEYKYYNMDQIVGVALSLFNNELSKSNG